MDREEEEEWEEQLVSVELVGMIDPDKLNMIDDKNTAVLGVASDDLTILKLGGYAFAGKYEDAVGSVVILEDVSEENQEPRLKYLGHTTKVIKANRIFLKSKAEASQEQSTDDNNVQAVQEETPVQEMNVENQSSS